MTAPRVLIIKTDGINRDLETVHAFSLAGAEAQVVHVNALTGSPRMLESAAMVVIPGGFSYGDDIAAGRVLAVELMARLGEQLRRFVARDGLILGICNGFQVLVRSGLLPGGDDAGRPRVSLAQNDSGRFECRWVRMRVEPGPAVVTQGSAGMMWEMPVAHGEGRLAATPDGLARLNHDSSVGLRYVDAAGEATEAYPENPNGSPGGAAALTDASGRIFGLMPHPECFVEAHQHPNWRRRGAADVPDGLWLFRNAVRAAGVASRVG